MKHPLCEFPHCECGFGNCQHCVDQEITAEDGNSTVGTFLGLAIVAGTFLLVGGFGLYKLIVYLQSL